MPGCGSLDSWKSKEVTFEQMCKVTGHWPGDRTEYGSSQGRGNSIGFWQGRNLASGGPWSQSGQQGGIVEDFIGHVKETWVS